MAKVKFYSEKEIKTLTSELLKNRKPADIAKKYSVKWNRPIDGLTYKIYGLQKTNNAIKKTKIGRPAGRSKKDVTVNSSDNGVRLKSGFVFDFAPVRAEMHSDHVRLYF